MQIKLLHPITNILYLARCGMNDRRHATIKKFNIYLIRYIFYMIEFFYNEREKEKKRELIIHKEKGNIILI